MQPSLIGCCSGTLQTRKTTPLPRLLRQAARQTHDSQPAAGRSWNCSHGLSVQPGSQVRRTDSRRSKKMEECCSRHPITKEGGGLHGQARPRPQQPLPLGGPEADPGAAQPGRRLRPAAGRLHLPAGRPLPLHRAHVAQGPRPVRPLQERPEPGLPLSHQPAQRLQPGGQHQQHGGAGRRGPSVGQPVGPRPPRNHRHRGQRHRLGRLSPGLTENVKQRPSELFMACAKLFVLLLLPLYFCTL